MAWNNQDFQHIPNPKNPMVPRPTALIHVLGKTAEKNGFSKSKVESKRNTHQFACIQWRKEYHSVHNWHLGKSEQQKASVLFLDLEKAVELSNPAAILEKNWWKKRAKGKLLHWIKNNVLRRRGRVKFQGVVSNYKQLHKRTLQGGILSLFLFNVLMENIAELIHPMDAKSSFSHMTSQ